MSKIRSVKDQLRDRNLQSLYAVNYDCLQHKFQYWAQHCYPEDIARAASMVDDAILEVVRASVSDEVADDPLFLRRMRLPARMFGGVAVGS